MKKQIKVLVSLTLIALMSMALMACGNTNNAETPKPEDEATAPITIKVGASATPHAEILESVKPLLAEQNINLEVVVFDDYVLPNEALANKELDANYFQHVPYLNDFNANNGTELSPAAQVHFEPMGIYAGKVTDLADLSDGATVAVPSDATNEARALLLLEQAGLIKVNPDAGLQATAIDITENPKNIKLQELEAAQVSRSLPDVSIGVINGNYALLAGLTSKDAIAIESPDSIAAQTFANVLVVRTGDETNENIQALVKALSSDTCRTFITDTYSGSVFPLF